MERKDSSMNTGTRTMHLAAAAFLGLATATAAIAPAFAEEAKKPEQVMIDTRTTGSVSVASRNCDPTDPKAGIVCRVTHGENQPHFPSAPVNPAFGF
jgi:hypothetical protein